MDAEVPLTATETAPVASAPSIVQVWMPRREATAEQVTVISTVPAGTPLAMAKQSCELALLTYSNRVAVSKTRAHSTTRLT